MRPERLEIEGFAMFREPAIIDFTDADLFALSGPTGAGKSSVIDAITFALYGLVSRFDDRRIVAPVITPGRTEARVRLDFRVGDEHYVVVRVVRAQARGGATTKEARLERRLPGDDDGRTDVLAGNADEVTAAVESLLGLSFLHFTTCVVLPQGEFARFLHHKPRDRQDLLVELLDLGVYAAMASAARARAADAGGRRSFAAKQLEELADFTPERRSEIDAYVGTLEKLMVAIDTVQVEVDELARAALEQRTLAAEVAETIELLESLSAPEGIDELATLLSAAEVAVEDARRAEDLATAALGRAEEAADALPSRSVLEQAARDHEDRAAKNERIAKGDQVVAGAVENEAAAIADLDAARAAHQAASDALEHARRTDRARDFASTLVVGEPCPVCLQTVHDLPAHELGDLAALSATEAATATAERKADDALTTARSDRVRAADLIDELRRQIAELDERLADHPDPDTVAAELARYAVVDADLKQQRAATTAARDARVAAEGARSALEDREASARRTFAAERDRVAVLGPPPASQTDLVADWEELLAWADGHLPGQREQLEKTRTAEAAAEKARAARLEDLAAMCVEAGLDVTDRAPRDTCIEYLADARADLASIDDALERAVSLRVEVERLTEEEAVAATLARHLDAKHFEKWVLDAALRQLVDGATEILFGLSGGAYSLTLEAKTSNFFVIDHANADAVRSARTLSGGETFLTALALALALADQVAQLAAGGQVRLESIFLDEGFGTLDPDTLDTVASAIEELGARGRMVGLVTHVRDLAERLPVRFEVAKIGSTSTVTRVDV